MESGVCKHGGLLCTCPSDNTYCMCYYMRLCVCVWVSVCARVFVEHCKWMTHLEPVPYLLNVFSKSNYFNTGHTICGANKGISKGG